MTQYSLQPTEIGKWKYQKRYHFLKCDLLSRHRIENIEKNPYIAVTRTLSWHNIALALTFNL